MKQVWNISVLMSPHTFLLEMGQWIQKIIKRLDEVVYKSQFREEIVDMQFENTKEQTESEPFVCSLELIEIVGDQEVTKLLICSRNRRKLWVLTIIGMGGLGKNNLAELV
uniref:Uncharacterized protein n=1 Tax=Davidia involucrata TaxID=16924 RepID=A0A5B6ZE00_DAVIN